jgi:hypothetical protein
VSTDHGVAPEVSFQRLTDALPGAPVGLSRDERDALLDLARVAAHTSERWTAPITTFLAGVALGDADPDVRAAALQRLVAALEAGSAR